MKFGERLAGKHYHPRPGSYAVICGAGNAVAIMATEMGHFLPGGGALPNESPETTLHREIWEECGRHSDILRPLGFAVEYVHAEGEGYFAKHCSFFHAIFREGGAGEAEGDHRLIWLSPSTAQQRLTHCSQAWAIDKLLAILT